ncbi:MAG: hypothetical protein JW818_04450 [Pirellulales bacterium]|nr:hypothetical protein [Pirellulales bacterium]
MNAHRSWLAVTILVVLFLPNAFCGSPDDGTSKNKVAKEKVEKKSKKLQQELDQLKAEETELYLQLVRLKLKIHDLTEELIALQVGLQGEHSPLLGLDGCCPVTLVEEQRWELGDPDHWVVSGSHFFRMADAAKKRLFQQSPKRYTPILDGCDPVGWLEEKRLEPGRREHGVFYRGRIVLCRDEQSLERFRKDPDRYLPKDESAVRLPEPDKKSEQPTVPDADAPEVIEPPVTGVHVPVWPTPAPKQPAKPAPIAAQALLWEPPATSVPRSAGSGEKARKAYWCHVLIMNLESEAIELPRGAFPTGMRVGSAVRIMDKPVSSYPDGYSRVRPGGVHLLRFYLSEVPENKEWSLSLPVDVYDPEKRQRYVLYFTFQGDAGASQAKVEAASTHPIFTPSDIAFR